MTAPDMDDDDRVKCEACWQRFFPEMVRRCLVCEEQFCEGCYRDHIRHDADCAPHYTEKTP